MNKPIEEMTDDEVIAEVRRHHAAVYGVPFRKTVAVTVEQCRMLLEKIRVRVAEQARVQSVCDTEPNPELAGRYDDHPSLDGLGTFNKSSGGGRRVIRSGKSFT